MVTQAERLAKALARVDAIQDQLAATSLLPDYGADGVSIQRLANRRELREELKELLEHTIPTLQGPFEVHADPGYCE